ncbi:MAG: hypothetical protein WB791_05240 [Waddliaceae bacterium]
MFKIGDKASYTISQKLTAETEDEFFDEIRHIQSEGIIDLDIEILSSNQEIFSYPFDVEVTLRKILISEIQQDGKSTTIIEYDSDGLKNTENYILEEYLSKLINHPLNFRIEKDF